MDSPRMSVKCAITDAIASQGGAVLVLLVVIAFGVGLMAGTSSPATADRGWSLIDRAFTALTTILIPGGLAAARTLLQKKPPPEQQS